MEREGGLGMSFHTLCLFIFEYVSHLSLPCVAGALTWEIMLGRLLCKRLPARFRQWEIPEGDRMQKKARSQGLPSPLPCRGGSWSSSCSCCLGPASCGWIHCDCSFLGGPCSGLWYPISLLCLSSTRRGGHTLKLLTSRSPHLSLLAFSVSSNTFDTRTSPFISQAAVKNIKSASLYVLPILLSLLNQKDFANLAEREEKEETQIWYGYIPVLRKKIVKVKLTLNQHHTHTHTHTHTRTHHINGKKK